MGALASRERRTILVHEWTTGGGLAGAPLPPSWAAEGRAMRRALAADFAAARGAPRVIVTLDDRLSEPPGPWTVAPIAPGAAEERTVALARAADFTLIVAPETMGILARLTRLIEAAGATTLGSSPEAVELAGDKRRMADWLRAHEIDTPRCRLVRPGAGLPEDAIYPAVLKPIDGAGSIDTFLVNGPGPRELPAEARRMPAALLQAFLPGAAMSASFLIDHRGCAWPLGAGFQEMAIQNGRFIYRGGRLPARNVAVNAPFRAMLERITGLRGFVGVDFLWDAEARHATVLEINPRPTTSCVAFARLLPPGRMADAWLEACSAGTRGEEEGPCLLEDLERTVNAAAPVAFDADGTIHRESEAE